MFDIRETVVSCLSSDCEFWLGSGGLEPTCNFKLIQIDESGKCGFYKKKEE